MFLNIYYYYTTVYIQIKNILNCNIISQYYCIFIKQIGIKTSF